MNWWYQTRKPHLTIYFSFAIVFTNKLIVMLKWWQWQVMQRIKTKYNKWMDYVMYLNNLKKMWRTNMIVMNNQLNNTPNHHTESLQICCSVKLNCTTQQHSSSKMTWWNSLASQSTIYTPITTFSQSVFYCSSVTSDTT